MQFTEKEEAEKYNMIKNENKIRQKIIPIAINVADRKKSSLKLISFVLLFMLTLIFIIFLYLGFYKYKSYTIISQRDLSTGSFIAYKKFGKDIIKYSKDGLVYLDEKGKELWLESYDMKAPSISISKNYFVIADIKGNKIYIFSKNEKLSEIDTALPITKVTISDTGIVAGILEDANASYISFYDYSGKALNISIKSKISGDGYPTDLAISPSGKQLMVSYQYIDSGNLRGRVVFYDFSEVGKSVANRIVGGFDEEFSDSLIARLKYMNQTYSFAIADTGLYFFSSKNLLSPELIKKYTFSENNTGEISSIAYNDKYIVVVYKNINSNKKYRFEIYEDNGKKICSKDIDYEYKFCDIEKKEIYFYTFDSRLIIYNINGNLKLNTNIDIDIKSLKKVDLLNSYTIFTETAIQNIKLK